MAGAGGEGEAREGGGPEDDDDYDDFVEDGIPKIILPSPHRPATAAGQMGQQQQHSPGSSPNSNTSKNNRASGEEEEDDNSNYTAATPLGLSDAPTISGSDESQGLTRLSWCGEAVWLPNTEVSGSSLSKTTEDATTGPTTTSGKAELEAALSSLRSVLQPPALASSSSSEAELEAWAQALLPKAFPSAVDVSTNAILQAPATAASSSKDGAGLDDLLHHSRKATHQVMRRTTTACLPAPPSFCLHTVVLTRGYCRPGCQEEASASLLPQESSDDIKTLRKLLPLSHAKLPKVASC